MPRPKRPKLIQTAPTILRAAKQSVASAVKKQREIFTPTSSGRVTTTSDDSDGLVMTKRTGARGKNAKSTEYTMSGALTVEDVGETRPRPPSGPTRAALSRIAREADHQRAIAERKEKETRSQKSTGSDQLEVPSSQASGSKQPARRNGNRLGPSAPGSNGPGSRLQQTPLAQSSMLGPGAFKKRPRQPSLLKLAQAQPDTTENLHDEDLDDEDLYDFRPDDESTPMVKSLLHTAAQHTLSSSNQISNPRKRKLASPEIQVPASQSQPQSQSLSSPSAVLSQPLQREDRPSSLSETNPEPELPHFPTPRTPPQIHSDTLAPPLSSSPAKPPLQSVRQNPSKRSKTTKPKRPLRLRNPSPASSPHSTASLTSPARSHPRKQAQPLTTAHLQNLLPKRRARAQPKTAYDVPSSDAELDNTALGEDEDELSLHAAGKMRRKQPAPPATGVLRRNRGKENALPLRQRAGKGKGKGGGRAVKVTYTRKIAGDGEAVGDDESEGEGNSGVPPAPGVRGAKKEMERMAAQFREVDEFEMEFEDVTGSSSQMRDAR